jgi:hypothetical protein
MRTRGIASALAGYVVVGAVMLAPITSYRHLDSALYGADTRLNAWALAWVDHAVLDRAPVFDANIFFPAPNALAYSEHLLGISLFALPIYALTRNAALSYNVMWLLSYLACALAGYALAWRVTRDRLASWVGGLAYAFCFYRMLHGHAHLQLLWACWIPFSLLLVERWWREPSWPRLSRLWLVVLVQVLTSWYLAVMVLLADALFAIWLVIWERPRPERRMSMALQVAVAGGAGAALVWPIARHYIFLVGLNGQSPADAVAGAIAWRDLVVPPLNTWLGQWLVGHNSRAPSWIWGEKTLFLGYVTLALGALGLSTTWWPAGSNTTPQERRGQKLWLGFMSLLSLVALMLAFGPSADAVATGSFDWTPFGLLSMVPGMSLFRVPARLVQLVTLALSVFAAAGAAMLHARFGRAGRVLTLLLVPIMLGEWYLVDFPGGAPQPEPIPSIYRRLAQIPARAVVSLPDYIGGPEWFTEADYQYYATAHWHPIVNGYSRTEPPGYRERMAAISTFPSHESARTLRAIGADYLVLHTKRYREGADAKVRAALSSTEFTLAAMAGPDYLFHVLPAKR